jgi:CP family cyanate transporter-like MFS transporter
MRPDAKPAEPTPSRARRWLGSTWLRVAGVLAVAVILRPSIAGVGPIIDDIQTGLSLPGPAISLLTTLPVLCFGAGAFLGPTLARRLGVDVGLALVLLLLTVALIVRVSGGPVLLFTGTVVAGGAIALANVLLPRIVKQDFARHAGLMTGLYTATLSVAAGLASLIAVPLERWTGHGWRGSLLVWGFVAAVAFVIWLPQLSNRHVVDLTPIAPVPARELLRNRRALALTAFMGLQSLSYYACLTWLPSLLKDNGYSATAAGAFLSLVTALGIPAALAIPSLAARAAGQSRFAVGCAALVWFGFLGLLLAPSTATVLWVILLGLGTGASFPLALLLMVLRSSSPAIAGQLSSMSQGLGYLIAACGPFLVGILHDETGSWHPPLVLLLGLVICQGISGGIAGRPGIAA